MIYEVNLQIDVDEEAAFLEVDRDTNVDVIMDMLRDYLYDLDDIKVLSIYVEEL